MKKLMAFALAAAVTLSLSACRRAGDVGMENRNNGVTDNNTNQGRIAGLENNNKANNVNANYKDGTYTGFGDARDNGNERAIVTIRNGRIVDVDLDRINQQGGANTGTAAGTGTDNTGRVGTGLGIMNAPGSGAGVNNTNGNNNGGTLGNAIGNAAGAAGDAFNTARTNLITAIVQNQRHDVDIENNDTNTRGTVDNWKLAVQRALDQARR